MLVKTIFMMKTKLVLLFVLLLSTTMMAQEKAPKKNKNVNNALGVCVMGKTMQCNGITMSYIATEQAEMSFAFGAVYQREYMLGSSPLGILTGVNIEYCHPYNKTDIDGQTIQYSAHDFYGVIPVMLQYHDKLGDRTELQLFTGPSLDISILRFGKASMGIMTESTTFLFGSPLKSGENPVWHWLGASWNYGIGFQHNDIIVKISSSLGLFNYFDKDYTAQYIGYPLRINRPIIGTVLFKL